MLQETKLTNGLRIITDYDPNAKTTTLSYTVKVGCYDENKDILGLAHLTEHMLFKGTTHRNSQEISECIESIGGILNAETSFQHTKYYCTVPAEFWKTGIEVVSDLIWNNTLPEEEFEREKQVVLEELKMYNDDPSSKVWDLLFVRLHPSYINRQYVGGTLETVKKLTRQQMIEFIDKFYIPNNIVIIGTGNVDHKELVDFIDKYCNSVDFISGEINRETFEPDKLSGKDAILKKDVAQSHLCWGMFGPKASDNDCVIGRIIATILAGNSSSRLYQIIREQQGLAYTVSMQVEVLKDTSILVGYVGLDGNNINSVKKIIVEEIEKLKTEKVSDQELNKVKTYIKGTTLIAFEKTSSQNSFISDSVINGTNNDIEEIFKTIEEVKSEDIVKFANKYFSKDNICFAQVIPK